MSRFSVYTADTFEAAIADALHNKDVQAAVSLLRVMAVEHPRRAEIVLNNVQDLLNQLRVGSVEP